MESLAAGYGAGGAADVVTAGFTAAVAPGTFACVLGANGAGKSTLLRTIAKLQRPLSGAVAYGGEDMAGLPLRRLARTVSIVLTDRRADVMRLTVRELVSAGRIPHTGLLGAMSRLDEEAVDEAMEQTGVSHLSMRRTGTLSDGERQKALVAKSLAQQTPVLLLDEPTAFLDLPSEAELFRLMRRLAHREGKIVLAATHDIQAALHTADRLWVLSRGEAPVQGAPRELAAAGRLDAFFEGAGADFDRARLSFKIRPD